MAAYHVPAEDLDLLALGALDLSERQSSENHIRECDECQRELAAAQARMAIMALAAPQQKPSHLAKEQLMARIATIGGNTSIAHEAEIRLPRRTMWTLTWAGLAFGLAVAAILLWVSNEHLSREMQGLRQDTAQLQQQFQQNEEQNRALVQLFTAPDTLHVTLAPVAGQQSGPARVEYNSHRGLLFYDGTLPPISPEHDYQLWLVPETGNPISAGLVHPNAQGQAIVVLPSLPAGLAAKAFAVTIEPSGGMAQPTGPKVQIGLAG
jgi:anti-sigma-K factor RskA